ncbi:hypothetical protein LCGC14_2094460 [marine sediment metagenome]|uniref:Uncharacterized protein n=1 Tax=marine sediment metagenome TaxID=412755 RepID=A0A0F9EZ36_9ZZZZ
MSLTELGFEEENKELRNKLSKAEDYQAKCLDIIEIYGKLVIEFRATVKELKEKLKRNGYQQIWHRCKNGDVRPYPQVLCSRCLPSEDDRNFNPYHALKRGIK